jgi:polyisoprenoid-binding protein YceI
MRTTLSLLLLAFFANTSAPGAAATPETVVPAVGVKSVRLAIDGTSTMHDYSLVTTTLTVTSAVVTGESLLKPGALQNFEVQIPVNSFASDKDGLKQKMLETMKAEKYPVIVFALDDYTVEGTIIRANGTLTVAGVAKPIDLELNVRETPLGLEVTGGRALSMKEFGIKPPTMFMGMLKTNDQVTIKFQLQLAHGVKASN